MNPFTRFLELRDRCCSPNEWDVYVDSVESRDVDNQYAAFLRFVGSQEFRDAIAELPRW